MDVPASSALAFAQPGLDAAAVTVVQVQGTMPCVLWTARWCVPVCATFVWTCAMEYGSYSLVVIADCFQDPLGISKSVETHVALIPAPMFFKSSLGDS